MSRHLGWGGTFRRGVITVLATAVLAVPLVAAGTSAAAVRSAEARAALPSLLTTHRSLESDLCTLTAIDKEVHALAHLKGASCKDNRPESSDGCIVSSADWSTAKGLGVEIEVYKDCPHARLVALEDDFTTEDQSSQYSNQSLGVGKWSVGYWNAQYGQGESVSESKNYLVVLDATDPYIKIGNTNGFTPVPEMTALLTTIMSFA